MNALAGKVGSLISNLSVLAAVLFVADALFMAPAPVKSPAKDLLLRHVPESL